MVKKKTRKNLAPSFEVTKTYTGKRFKLPKTFSRTNFKIAKGILLVGYLEKLTCETPDNPNVDLTKKLVNKKGGKPLVCASGDGKLVLIISPDCVKPATVKNPIDLNSAIDLHTDFHGVAPPDPIKTIDVDTDNINHLIFCGWLNHIIYKVPNYSERKGLPYIHEARDKGDEEPKAKQKPYICVSPKKDMLVMRGPEMRFTDRGIIG